MGQIVDEVGNLPDDWAWLPQLPKYFEQKYECVTIRGKGKDRYVGFEIYILIQDVIVYVWFGTVKKDPALVEVYAVLDSTKEEILRLYHGISKKNRGRK